jgi:hypothetical protein
MRHPTSVALAALFTFWIGATMAQTPPASPASSSKPLSASLGLVVFPAKGQTPTKQAGDEGECFAWSKGQTGVDPFAPAPAPAQTAAPPAESKKGGERVRGAARGAAAGAVIGEIADNDASEGAAIGAAAGAMKGGAESRRAKKEAEHQAAAQAQQATEQQKAVQSEQLALFNKGFAACLEARNYTVK